MFNRMTSGPRAVIRALIKTEVLSGTQPHRFKISFGSHDDLMAGIPRAFNDGGYGFDMQPIMYHKHAGMFFRLDEEGIMHLKDTAPDTLCFQYNPEMGKEALIIEAGDDEKGPIGSISFIQLVLLTCYGTKMPNDFSPEVVRTRKSSKAAWKVSKAPARSMSREFCWPQLNLLPTSSLFSQEDATLRTRTNVCVWLVAWVFMMDRKSKEFVSPAEMAAQIECGGKKKLPRFMICAQTARQFLFAPDHGLSAVTNGSKMSIQAVSGAGTVESPFQTSSLVRTGRDNADGQSVCFVCQERRYRETRDERRSCWLCCNKCAAQIKGMDIHVRKMLDPELLQ